MRPRLVRDDSDAWKNATNAQRAIGLTVGVVLSAGPLLLVLVILGLFLTGRFH